MQTHRRCILALLLGFSASQTLPGQQEPQPGGWRRFGDPASASAEYPPSTLNLPAGTWITVRVDELLSSDRNQAGDPFTATLAQPLVANGWVVARRGQTVGGIVALAEKAGRVRGTSRLGLELNEISLVDGRQVDVRSRLIELRAGTSVGRDTGAIATTTGVGAAIGAAADGGFGAGMGAIAGAAASTIGVLVTRGRATEVYPESTLTFRLEAPVAVTTESSLAAFRPVAPEDYEKKDLHRRPSLLGPPPVPAYYSYYDPPFFYGPSFVYFSGPRFYRHRGYGRRW